MLMWLYGRVFTLKAMLMVGGWEVYLTGLDMHGLI